MTAPETPLAVRVLPADERFGQLGAHSEADGSEYLDAGYQCPEGPPGVSFSWRDVADRKAWGANLSPEEASALERPVTAALGGPPPQSGYRVAVDFRCPRCGRGVVVVFQQRVEEKDWTYEPDTVLEVERPHDTDRR